MARRKSRGIVQSLSKTPPQSNLTIINMATSETQTDLNNVETITPTNIEIGTDPINFEEMNPQSSELADNVNSETQDDTGLINIPNSSKSQNNIYVNDPQPIVVSQTRAETNTFQNQTVTNKTSEIQNIKIDTPEEKKYCIVQFSPSEGMLWRSWLIYFEGICRDAKLNDIWKIRNIQNFLKGKALTLFINNSLNILHWEELVELFNEEFTTPGEISLSDFSSIKFKHGDNLTDYYHKKLQVARSLGLESKLILQGLTDGLPSNLKQLVIVNSPKTTNEWRELVHKLEKIHISEHPTPTYINRVPNQNQEFRQWRTPRVGPGYQQNPRPNNYRFPQSNSSRFFNPSNMPYQSRGPRPTNPSTGNHVHFQESFPPSPCRICQQHRVMNAFHWHRNCPFRITNLTPSPNDNVNNAPNLLNSETTVKQTNSVGDNTSENY